MKRRERWRRVAHLPHLEVSDRGRVRSSYVGQGVSPDAPSPRLLRIDSLGRVAVRHQRKGYVSVMVLEAFVGPRPSGTHVAMHRDQDRSNNALRNLTWATPSELAIVRNPVGENHPRYESRASRKRSSPSVLRRVVSPQRGRDARPEARTA